MSDRFDVLVAGEYYCDLIFSGLDHPPMLGGEVFADGLIVRPGGCYNMALGLTRLGLRAAWACDLGTDRFSGIVRDAAKADGLDASAFREVRRSLQQVSVAFSGAGERGFITYREGTLRAPDTALLARLQPKWLLQTFRLEPDWMAFMRTAKAAGVKIFGDCNGEGADLDSAGVREFIGLCDVFSPNETEAEAVTKTRNVEDALQILSRLAPVVVIKRGPQGASAMASEPRYISVSPYPTAKGATCRAPISNLSCPLNMNESAKAPRSCFRVRPTAISGSRPRSSSRVTQSATDSVSVWVVGR